MSCSSFTLHLERLFSSNRKKYGEEIVDLTFRDKTHGWSATHNERFSFKRRKDVIDYTNRDFFNKCLSTRYSCHSCHFCNLNRPSDITIGDFWGYKETTAKELNKDDKGLSLLLLNTSKGAQLLQYLKDKMELTNVSNDNYLQPNLIHPTPKSPLRDKFMKDYCNEGFMYVAKKYSNWSVKAKLLYMANSYAYQFRLELRKLKRKSLKKG